MWRFERMVAKRYLWSARREAFITIITVISVLGVAIGVAVLNIVMAVMTGFQQEITDKIINTYSHITLSHLEGRIEAWEPIAAKISRLPGVRQVSPYTYHQALLRSQDRASGVLLRGIDPAHSEEVQSYVEGGTKLQTIFERRPLEPQAGARTSSTEEAQADLAGLLIGRELSRTMNLRVGGVVSLFSTQVSATPFGLIPKFRRFVVRGVYRSGLAGYENALAYLPLGESQAFFRMGTAVTGLEIRLKDADQAPVIAQRILDLLGQGSGFFAQPWTESNGDFFRAFQLEKRVYFIVLLLIIVMASFSIVTTLIMVVLEKRRDIAVLQTLGASSRSIARIFFVQGSAIGFCGTVLGLVLGLGGSLALQAYGFPLEQFKGIFPMDTLPVKIEWVNFAVSGAVSLLICMLTTIYPARRAARFEVVEALRHD